MKKLIVLAALCLVGLWLTSCAGISANADYDPGFDFTSLKTFGFLQVPSDAGLDQLTADKVGDALKTQLTAKGYSLAKDPDFAIAMHFGKQQKTNIDSWGYGWGGWGMWGGGGVDVNQYEEGTLVVDFVNMKDKKMIWRGVAKGALAYNPNAEEKTETINNAIAKMLTQFPPEHKAQ
jgi:hypothetical protein